MDVFWQMHSFITTYGARIIIALIVLVVGWIIVRIFKKITLFVLSKCDVEETVGTFLNSVFGALYYFILIAIVLTIAGVPSSYFAGMIIGLGTAIGFSLRDEFKTVSNGIIILLTKPFKVGDAINANNVSGVVKEIKIFQTKLRTFDNLEVIISNGTLLHNGVTKFNDTEPRRQDLVFGVSYDDDIKKVKALLEKIVKENELILKDPAPMIVLNEFADSSVNFLVRIWTKRENFFNTKFQLNETVKLTFDEQGISIPFPQRDVHLYEETKNS